jgi:hypothetical protein
MIQKAPRHPLSQRVNVPPMPEKTRATHSNNKNPNYSMALDNTDPNISSLVNQTILENEQLNQSYNMM